MRCTRDLGPPVWGGARILAKLGRRAEFSAAARTFTRGGIRSPGVRGIAAIAAAPWDREGVNDGFNIPARVSIRQPDEQLSVQIGAGFAGYGLGRVTSTDKLAQTGRDVVRAQIVSQVMVQGLKATFRRERPDGSNKGAFPSGHAASAFATAAVVQHHYGWKAGVPAYAFGSYVALARMSWNRHHATDVVMGAGFGLASARTVTMSVGRTRFGGGVQPEQGGASLQFTKLR
jgi:PAP2 superfamily